MNSALNTKLSIRLKTGSGIGLVFAGLSFTGLFFTGLSVLALTGCTEAPPDITSAPMRPNGDAERGRVVITQAGCGSCHHIPGINSAQGEVGPPLDKLLRRGYLAGILPNTFENLVLWIEQPQSVAPGSAMPDSGVTRAEAQDIATYLYTLE